MQPWTSEPVAESGRPLLRVRDFPGIGQVLVLVQIAPWDR